MEVPCEGGGGVCGHLFVGVQGGMPAPRGLSLESQGVHRQLHLVMRFTLGLGRGRGGAGAAADLDDFLREPEQGPSSGAPLTDLARREGRGAGRDSVPRKRLYFLKELGPKKGLTLRPTVTFIIGSGHCQSEFWGRVCGSVCGMPGAPHLPLTPHLASLGDVPTAPSGCRQFPGPGGGPWGVPAPAPASGLAA